MAILKLLEQDGKQITDVAAIKEYLNERGIIFEQWKTDQVLHENDSQETVLAAYHTPLSAYMSQHGYTNADVINVHPGTPQIDQIRQKFLSEHVHSEDEVRFFVDGEGEFFFHLESPHNEVFSILCQKGDFISVPKGHRHWFDLAPKYFVKAIRVFQTKDGWVASYTESGKEKSFIK